MKISTLILTAVLVLAMTSFASAQLTTDWEVIVNDEVIDFENDGIATFYTGESNSVRLTFTATQDEKGVRVIARILGEPGISDITEEFNILEGNNYSRLLSLDIPEDIDTNSPYILEISVETNFELLCEDQMLSMMRLLVYDCIVLAIE